MLRDRPRLLVIDDDPGRRIALVSTLGASFDAWPLADGDEPLRAARLQRPDVAVVVYGGRRTEAALRLIRTLRSDTRPVPHVAALEFGGRPRGAFVAMELWLADGWLELPAPPEEILEFVEATVRGERPRRPGRRGPGTLGKILNRLRPRSD